MPILILKIAISVLIPSAELTRSDQCLARAPVDCHGGTASFVNQTLSPEVVRSILIVTIFKFQIFYAKA